MLGILEEILLCRTWLYVHYVVLVKISNTPGLVHMLSSSQLRNIPLRLKKKAGMILHFSNIRANHWEELML